MIGDMLRWRLAGLRFGKLVAEMPFEDEGKGTMKLYKSNGTFTAVTDCGGKIQALALKEISKDENFAVPGVPNSKTTQYVLATQTFKNVAAADIADKKKYPYVHITYTAPFKVAATSTVAAKDYKALGAGVLEISADTSYNFATAEESTSGYQPYGETQMAPGYRRSYAITPKRYGRSFAYGVKYPKYSGNASGAYGVNYPKYSGAVVPQFNTRREKWAWQSGQDTFVDEAGAVRPSRHAKMVKRGRGF